MESWHLARRKEQKRWAMGWQNDNIIEEDCLESAQPFPQGAIEFITEVKFETSMRDM